MRVSKIDVKAILGDRFGNAILLKEMPIRYGMSHKKRRRVLLKCVYEHDGKPCNEEIELDLRALFDEDTVTPIGCRVCRRKESEKMKRDGTAKVTDRNVNKGPKVDSALMGQMLLRVW